MNQDEIESCGRRLKECPDFKVCKNVYWGINCYRRVYSLGIIDKALSLAEKKHNKILEETENRLYSEERNIRNDYEKQIQSLKDELRICWGFLELHELDDEVIERLKQLKKERDN